MIKPCHKYLISTISILWLVINCSSLGASEANPAAQAAPRTINYDWMSIAQWREQHNAMVKTASSSRSQLLFLGDSITAGWSWDENSTIFNTHFAQYHALNFGIGGDQTQHLLWRLQNGALGSLQPKLIVLQIGINNFGHSHHSAEQVAGGVTAIVNYLKQQRSKSKILLLAMFPAEHEANRPIRANIQHANELLKSMAKEASVAFYDFGNIFLNSQDEIPNTLMADFLHPTRAGYQKLADKLAPIVNEMIGSEITQYQY